jgi:hypothetical protein
MRQYSAAIYTNENLLLTELLEKIEAELPVIGFNLYGNTLAGSEIVTGMGEYEVRPAGRLADEEILIVLSDPQADVESLKNFDGDIIDFTGAFTDKDVYRIEDPVAHIINSVVSRNDEVAAVATVPAALFGKSGIDDLINQTRELFAFTETETKVFDNRLAFNMFFSDFEKGLLAGYRQKLLKDTGVDVEVRMAPVSTGFVLDVYFKKDVNSNFTFSSPGSYETLSDAAASGGIVTLSNKKGKVSFAGDYIHTIVGQITDALKDITGEN